MASADEKLIIQIELDDGSVQEAFLSIEKGGERASRKVSEAFSNSSGIDGINESLKELNRSIKESSDANVAAIKSTSNFSENLALLGVGITGVAAGLFLLSGSALKTLGVAAFASNRTIVGLVDNLLILTATSGLGSVAASGLGASFASVASSLGAVSAGAAVAVSAIVFALAKLGDGVRALGSRIVEFAKSSVASFSEFQQASVFLNNIVKNFNVVTDGAVGSTQSWTAEIERLSRQLGLSQTALSKSAAEIIQVTSRLGLNEQQMRKLIQVSAEYAQINGKDVFNTTVALVSALNGNSQAVLQYGIKLTEASNIVFGFKSGLQDSFSTLSEGEKVQVRFNNLLSQYAGVAGIAAATSGTLANQANRLESNLETLNARFGRGAAVIENWQVLNLLANTAVESLNENVVTAAGFISALSGRFLQGAGIVLKYGISLFSAVRFFQLFEAALSSIFVQNFFNRQFSILGNSIAGLARSASRGTVDLTSFVGIVKTLTSILQARSAQIFQFFTGIQVASVSFSAIGAALTGRLIGAFQALVGIVSAAGLAIAPFLLKLGLIAGAVFLVVEALKVVEAQTGVFSGLLSSLKEIFGGVAEAGGAVASLIGKVLAPVFNGFAALLDRTVGFIAFLIAGFFELVTAIASVIPGFNTLFDGLEQANQRLTVFRQNIVSTGFSAKEFGKTISASVIEANNAVKALNFEKLADIRQRVFDLEAGERGKLNKALFDDVQAIAAAAEQGLLSSAEAGRQITVLSNEYWKQVAEIRKKGLSELQSDIDGLKRELETVGLSELEQVTQVENQRIQILQQARAQGLVNKAEFEALFTKIQQDASEQRQAIIEKETFTWNDALKEISDSAVRFGPLISGVVQRIGAAFVQGSNAFSDFRAFIFNIFGDILIQVGFAVAGIGKAIEALKAAFASFSGGFAIGAGLALIALGGLLKASAGTLGSAAAAGAAGNIGPGGNTPTFPVVETLPPIESARQGTEVNINIEGNVLDRRDTGLAIAEVLQEFFDTNNGVLVRT